MMTQNQAIMPMTSGRAEGTKPSRWSFDECYQALSYSFRIRTNLEQEAAILGRLLARFRTEPERGVPVYTLVYRPERPSPFAVRYGGDFVEKGSRSEIAVDYVLWDINRKVIEATDDLLTIHAAAASWQGRGIVLPAKPDSGKTTIVAGLTRVGFDYFSDEAVPIDPVTRLVMPYPRPLWMDRSSVEALERLGADLFDGRSAPEALSYHVLPDDLRGDSVGSPCRIRYVISPQYEAGGRTHLEPISRAAATVLLAENSFNFKQFGADGLRLLRDVVSEAECYQLSIADLGEAVHALQELMAA